MVSIRDLTLIWSLLFWLGQAGALLTIKLVGILIFRENAQADIRVSPAKFGVALALEPAKHVTILRTNADPEFHLTLSKRFVFGLAHRMIGHHRHSYRWRLWSDRIESFSIVVATNVGIRTKILKRWRDQFQPRLRSQLIRRSLPYVDNGYLNYGMLTWSKDYQSIWQCWRLRHDGWQVRWSNTKSRSCQNLGWLYSNNQSRSWWSLSNNVYDDLRPLAIDHRLILDPKGPQLKSGDETEQPREFDHPPIGLLFIASCITLGIATLIGLRADDWAIDRPIVSNVLTSIALLLTIIGLVSWMSDCFPWEWLCTLAVVSGA